MTGSKKPDYFKQKLNKLIIADAYNFAQEMIACINVDELNHYQKKRLRIITENGKRRIYKPYALYRLADLLGKKIKLTLE